MSSIKDEVSVDTITNEVRLQRAAFTGSFLMVEGSTDAQLLSRFISGDDCSIIICLGRDNLFGAISKLEAASFAGALGIADRDLCDIIGYPEYEGVVIFTDENDLETQILASKALTRLLIEFGSKPKLEIALKDGIEAAHFMIASWTAPSGALRLASACNRWSLTFSGMTYQFVSNVSPQLCGMKTSQHVVRRTACAGGPTESEAFEAVNAVLGEYLPWRLSHGHDCVAVLAKALQRELGNTNQFNSESGRTTLDKILRLAYDLEIFRESRIYAQIRSWEKATGYTVLQNAQREHKTVAA